MNWVAWLAGWTLLVMLPMLAHYRPTLPDRVLEHPIRRKIVELLRERPMTSKKTLQDRLRCAAGELEHHTRVLEQCRILDSIRVGRYRRYFIAETDAQEARAIGVLRGSKERLLARKILEDPGVVQQELTSQLDISRKMIRSYMDRLVAAGLIEERIVGRQHEYYPGEPLATTMEEALRGFGGRRPPLR